MLQSDIIRRADRFGRAAVRERLLSPQMVQKTKAVRFPHGMKIFEVQDKATGHGIYKCYEQKLVSAEWDDTTGDDKLADESTTEVEVLNLNESDPVNTTYEPALFLYDRMMAWRIDDNQRKRRWVGIPVGPPIRLVRAFENAPATDVNTTTIICDAWLDTKGDIAASGELGYHIEVKGRSAPLSSNWNAVFPVIATGYYYHAYCKNGTWYFNDMFMTNIPCTCVAP